MGKVTTSKPLTDSYEEKDGYVKYYFECKCGHLSDTGFRTSLEVAEAVAEIARKMSCHACKYL